MATPDLLPILTLTIVALIASVISAVTGFGGAVILLPVVVWVFGVREAIPILTVAQVVGNLARVVEVVLIASGLQLLVFGA